MGSVCVVARGKDLEQKKCAILREWPNILDNLACSVCVRARVCVSCTFHVPTCYLLYDLWKLSASDHWTNFAHLIVFAFDYRKLIYWMSNVIDVIRCPDGHCIDGIVYGNSIVDQKLRITSMICIPHGIDGTNRVMLCNPCDTETAQFPSDWASMTRWLLNWESIQRLHLLCCYWQAQNKRLNMAGHNFRARK